MNITSSPIKLVKAFSDVKSDMSRMDGNLTQWEHHGRTYPGSQVDDSFRSMCRELDDATLGGITELRTLALGHESLFRSVHKSFCLHFDVLSEVSLGGPPSFSEMDHPCLIDAKVFVDEVLSDPDASFNQR